MHTTRFAFTTQNAAIQSLDIFAIRVMVLPIAATSSSATAATSAECMTPARIFAFELRRCPKTLLHLLTIQAATVERIGPSIHTARLALAAQNAAVEAHDVPAVVTASASTAAPSPSVPMPAAMVVVVAVVVAMVVVPVVVAMVVVPSTVVMVVVSTVVMVVSMMAVVVVVSMMAVVVVVVRAVPVPVAVAARGAAGHRRGRLRQCDGRSAFHSR